WVISAMKSAAHAYILESISGWGWDPHGWIAWGIFLVTQVVLLVVGAMTFSFVATIAASPFNDFLAESSEKFALPPLPPVPKTTWGDMFRLMGIDVLKTLGATAATLVAILFAWVPVLN